ncbi:ubiquitin carboxyl-terminal hydrolase 19-like isoform X2 [Dendronephthya gigantea]|nr:ubiquitin carboxyl-terminal hydrolase 19-like isoform X2 [Dendronephthya gigantea]
MPEETFLCDGVASGTKSCAEHKYNNVPGKKTDAVKTYLLEHLRFDFYKKARDLLIVSVYVKEIDKSSLQVIFGAKILHLKFQTRSKDFLKLYNQVSEETVFEWNVNLRHDIDEENCKYVLSPFKLTITLKRACVRDPWNSLEELHFSAVGDNKSRKSAENHTTGNLHEAKSDSRTTSTKINDDVKLCNGNEDGLCNTNQIASAENNVVLDETGVPDSLAEDANGVLSNRGYGNIRTNKTGDTNRNKDDEVDEKSIGLDCNYSKAGLHDSTKKNESIVDKENKCDSTSKHTNMKCTNSISKQNGLENENLSNSTSTGDDNNETTDNPSHSNDDSLPMKVTSTNRVQTKSPESVDENQDLKLSYDACKQECRPGSVGLLNTENLCYINSIVQCLSSVRELRTYLLSKKYSGHINLNNKNGYQGELIITFQRLIQQLWSGKTRCISASKLKHIISKKNKQFKHYDQGDAQEFLTFLLDGLHEELRKEKKKPGDEMKADDSKDIRYNSRVHWENYVNGNQSIVSDLFQGQSVSEIYCDECAKPSTSFDHWMQLNLPIPEDPKYLSIHVFFFDPEKIPLKTKLKVFQATRCSDLLAQLSDIVGVPAHCLLLLCSQDGKISRVFDPEEKVTFPSNNEVIIACEILDSNQDFPSSDTGKKEEYIESCQSYAVDDNDKRCNNRVLHIPVIQRLTHKIIKECSHCGDEKSSLSYCSKCCKRAYCDRECQTNDWKSHRPYCKFRPSIIGAPFVISVNASEATLKQLKKIALDYARYSVAKVKGDLASSKFEMTLLENVADIHSKGKKLNDKEDKPVVDENVCLALDWVTKTSDTKVISKDIVCNIHSSVSENSSSQGDNCSLEECLKLYWNPENINKECG